MTGTRSTMPSSPMGEPWSDHLGRFGTVEALGLDEALKVRRGQRRRQEFSTQIVHVGQASSSTSSPPLGHRAHGLAGRARPASPPRAPRRLSERWTSLSSPSLTCQTRSRVPRAPVEPTRELRNLLKSTSRPEPGPWGCLQIAEGANVSGHGTRTKLPTMLGDVPPWSR